MKATPNILFNLQAARLLIDDPAAWCQRTAHRSGPAGVRKSWCLIGAVVDTGYVAAALYLNSYVQAHAGTSAVWFNDQPKATHARVLRMLDEAILQAGADVFG